MNAHPISRRNWFAMTATKVEISIAMSFDQSLDEIDARYIVADSKVIRSSK